MIVLDSENGVEPVRQLLSGFAKHYGVSRPSRPQLKLLSVNAVPPEWESAGHTLFDSIRDWSSDEWPLRTTRAALHREFSASVTRGKYN